MTGLVHSQLLKRGRIDTISCTTMAVNINKSMAILEIFRAYLLGEVNGRSKVTNNYGVQTRECFQQLDSTLSGSSRPKGDQNNTITILKDHMINTLVWEGYL